METTHTIQIGPRCILNPQEIMFLSADINYTEIYLSNGKKIMVATTLKKFEKCFINHSEFCRTHKSFLININYVKRYNLLNNDTFVEMENDFRAEISRRRKPEFWRKLQMQRYL